MSPSLICLDQQHPLKAGIAARFGLGVGSLDEGWQGDGPRLLIAPWWMALPDPWPGSALLRHGPLVSDLRHHDNAISLQRLLLWPYGTAAMAWLADADLLEAIGAWLGDPWEGERWLEGPEAFSAEQTAAAIQSALEGALASAEAMWYRRSPLPSHPPFMPTLMAR